MDDDVFFQPREKRESFEYPSRETRVDRDPTTSTRTFFPNKTENESQDEESVVDEESTAGESSEESLSDEDDTDEEEEKKFEKEEKEETDEKRLVSRVEKSIKIEVQGSCETAIPLKQSKAQTTFTESEKPSVAGTPRISKKSVAPARCLNAIKAELSQIDEVRHGILVPKLFLNTQSRSNNAVLAIKKEPGTENHTNSSTPTITNGSSFLAPQLTTEIHVPNSSIIGFKNMITMKDHPKTPPSSSRLSTPRQTGETKHIKSVLGEEPLKEINPSDNSSRESVTVKHQQILSNNHHKKNVVELAVPDEQHTDLSAMALSERPKRKIKPTEKVATLASIHHSIDHNLTIENNSKKQERCTNGKRQNRRSSPYCKHCELIAEEKRRAKNESKVKNALETNASMTSTLGVSEPVGSKPKALKDQPTRNSGGREGVNAPKRLSTQSKRPSGTVASNEPEKKKQKLIDSDLLSIPSSLAIIVDTELIAAENPSLDSSNIPKFSENGPTVSIWESTVDIQWIKDVKIARGKTKNRQFFGVPVAEYPTDIPVINFWVDNLFREETTKDRFATDYRRYMAQGSKARKDGKAGYEIR
ncbi:hypothetical protein GCK72_002114 [Caenorhabditis remanei]|uniref:Uncharacterized protein n=1 Tax=Caenorhabditis remanei TaxID=31234 RepID=A0A6A5HU52_CAERE|nr:hypothetical protein GCK72_002114 [Caenorhabditis remanei]KAF1770296.1 hypothetical protein GCK72_002114 [Caenorhabditis remanei]